MDEALDTDQAETRKETWQKVNKAYHVANKDCAEPFEYDPFFHELTHFTGVFMPWNPTKLNRTNGPFATGGIVHLAAALNQLNGCSSVCIMSSKSCETVISEEYGSHIFMRKVVGSIAFKG